MAQVARESVSRLREMLSAAAGLPGRVAAIAARENLLLPEVNSERILSQQVSPELAERTAGAQYPVFYLYCEKIINRLREKFRTFSGQAKLVVEVRVSHERLENLNKLTELCVEAVTDVLDAHRGDWGGGMFYGGGYDVSFQQVRHGGKNFIHGAKVTFEVEVSIG